MYHLRDFLVENGTSKPIGWVYQGRGNLEVHVGWWLEYCGWVRKDNEINSFLWKPLDGIDSYP